MTSTEGVDALGHPDPDAVKAAGKTFVAQYLKNVTPELIAAYHAKGDAVLLLDEEGGQDALSGYAKGLARGKAANLKLTALGAPAGTASIACETDFQPTPGQIPTCVQFYLGYAVGLGSKYRAGAYGDYDVMLALLAAGYKGVLVQCYAWSGDGHGGTKWAPGVSVEQYLNGQSIAGTGVDLDRALVAEFGAWAPPQPHGLPAPVGYPGDPIGWSTDNPRALAFLQRCLTAAGYTVPITSEYDSATRAAIGAYQRRHLWGWLRDGLRPGVVKANLWASLATYYGKSSS